MLLNILFKAAKGHPLFVNAMEDHLATLVCEKLLFSFLIIYQLKKMLFLFVMNKGTTLRNEEENLSH